MGLLGELARGGASDAACGAGDDGDAAVMHDRVEVAIDRRELGLDPEGRRWGAQRRGTAIGDGHRFCLGITTRIYIKEKGVGGEEKKKKKKGRGVCEGGLCWGCVRAVRLERAQSRGIGGVYIWQDEWEEREDSVREPMAPMTARMIRLFSI